MQQNPENRSRSAGVCDTCNVSLPERHRRRSIRNPAPAGREASRAKRESPVRPRPLPCEIRRTISDPGRWVISHTHLAGKRPISRQVEQYLAHLTGYDGDCRSVPAMTERVRGDGGEEGKRVSTIFFMRRKLFPLREGRFPVRSGMTRVRVKGEFIKESLPGGEGFRLIPWRRSGCLG